MTIENFTKSYLPVKELEREALKNFCSEHCGKHFVAIFNALMRGGICSIEDLYNADIETLKRLRNIGTVKLAYILDMKRYLNSQITD